MPTYDELEAITRDEAQKELASGEQERIARALVRLVLFDSDGVFLRELISRYLRHPNTRVQGIAATCASHLVRLHRELDLADMKRQLQRMRDVEDASTCGRVEDALGDFEVFR